MDQDAERPTRHFPPQRQSGSDGVLRPRPVWAGGAIVPAVVAAVVAIVTILCVMLLPAAVARAQPATATPTLRPTQPPRPSNTPRPTQTPRPTSTPRPTATPVELPLRPYGARQFLPLPGYGIDGPVSTTLHIAATGWDPVHVLVVEVAGGALLDSCPTGLATSRILSSRCLRLIPYAAADLVVGGKGAKGVLVYSLSAKKLDGCIGFETVRSGLQSLEAWETGVLNPNRGEPVAISISGAWDGAQTALAGNPALDLRPIVANPASAILAQGGSQVGFGEFTRWSAVNVTSRCLPAHERRMSSPGADGTCPDGSIIDGEYASNGVTELEWPGSPPSESLAIQGSNELSLLFETWGDAGWASTLSSAVLPGPDTSQLAFPLALAPNLDGELWVTNQHITATTKIAILMWNGNGKLMRLFNDPAPLCAGATRRYHVADLTGPVDPTGQGNQGQPAGEAVVSLRVESTNTALRDAPPIQGRMVLRGNLGVTVYPGQAVPIGVRVMSTYRRNGEILTVIPNVRINYGEPAMSTLLAVQTLPDRGSNQAYLSLYDRTGKRVLNEMSVNTGQGFVGAGFVDLGMLLRRRPPEGQALPTSFVGTAILQDRNRQGWLAAVAIDRPVPPPTPTVRPSATRSPTRSPTRTPGPGTPTATRVPLLEAGGVLLDSVAKPVAVPLAPSAKVTDALVSQLGIILPLWPNPYAPTPTATFTRRPTSTPTATAPPATVTTESTSTPTGVPASPARILLPWLYRFRGGGQ